MAQHTKLYLYILLILISPTSLAAPFIYSVGPTLVIDSGTDSVDFEISAELAPVLITSSDNAIELYGNDTELNLISGSFSTTLGNTSVVYSEAQTTKIVNDADLSTLGYNSSVIRINADYFEIINNGTISTSPLTSARSISLDTSSTSITNYGTITSSIYALSDQIAIVNFGSLDHVYAQASEMVLTNHEIMTTISAQADSLTLINTGLMRGGDLWGGDVEILNSGTSHGAMWSFGSRVDILNTGIIQDSSYYSMGIVSSVTNESIIRNSGNIVTSEMLSFGIYTVGNNISITNSGNIKTSGTYSHAIATGNSDTTEAVITNSGNIITAGLASRGIITDIVDSATAVIINNGSISTNGIEADAISANGGHTIITNSGLISAKNSLSYAILGDSSEVTLNIHDGSQIFGRIDLGESDDNDTVNVYGRGVSASLTFENTENINVFNSAALVGNRVVTMDQTSESMRSVALTGTTSAIHNLVNQRMSHTSPLKPIQLVSLELSPNMYFEEHKPVAWAQVFGGKLDRDAKGIVLAYDHKHTGINFGYEWDMGSQRVGLMGGFVNTTTKSQLASFKTETDNYYLGAYTNQKTHGLNITGSIIAGYGDTQNDRLVLDNIYGYETAKSNFHSWFVSPGVSIAQSYTLAEHLELRPSASLNYSIAWLDDYRESGTTNSNLSVEEHQVRALAARAQLAVAYELSTNSEFEFRVGLSSRQTNDEATKVSIAGSQFRFSTAGDKSVTGGFAGAAIRIMDSNNLTLVTDIELGGNSNENYAAGNLRIEYTF